MKHPNTCANIVLAAALTCGLLGAKQLSVAASSASAATRTRSDLVAPPGSGKFGEFVTVLPNGNIVVVDSAYDVTSPVTIQDVGAVHLYDGATLNLISTLRGNTANDRVGSAGITVLSNGNFVVASPFWNLFGLPNAGAATWIDANVGLSATVGSGNSLVGNAPGDYVGSISTNGFATGVYALSNGNYIVASPNWRNDTILAAGAVTWADGTTGIRGFVLPGNSLVGTRIGNGNDMRITVLNNGNYVVANKYWSDGVTLALGAVTWGNGATGTVGEIGVAISLIGDSAQDSVGDAVVALANGNYVVASNGWDSATLSNVGAVTWCNGATGRAGVVGPANSLIGASQFDVIGVNIVALANGNYVIGSPYWDHGAISDVGAATWVDGSSEAVGTINAANSLIGGTGSDYVGSLLTPLSNGNYVVGSRNWDNGAVIDAGAATWGNGATGVRGAVSSANSLVGSSPNDEIAYTVLPLNNGSYVVGSPAWDNGAISDAGAATWANGASGRSGAISPANSLVGATAGDAVGSSIMNLSNGNYVVLSADWDNGAVSDAGAATWGDGTSGVTGSVNTGNSMVGGSASDSVGTSALALRDGNYVLLSPVWDNGAVADVGAVTWVDGAAARSGSVSADNSLIGLYPGDGVGYGNSRPIGAHGYFVDAPGVDNGVIADAGALTWVSRSGGITGTVDVLNSLIGVASLEMHPTYDGIAYDEQQQRLAIGLPNGRRVAIIKLDPELVVSGNAQLIANDDVSPSAADGTDFGSTQVTGGVLQRTFVIANAGEGRLNISDIAVDTTAFIVSGPLSVTVEAGERLSVTVTFDPSATGPVDAMLTIKSDYPGDDTYRFALRGTGVAGVATATPTATATATATATPMPTATGGNRKTYLPIARRAG